MEATIYMDPGAPPRWLWHVFFHLENSLLVHFHAEMTHEGIKKKGGKPGVDDDTSKFVSQQVLNQMSFSDHGELT